MASNNKREQEYKKRKRRENDQDSAPVTAARVLWFIVKFVLGAAATLVLIAVTAGILFSVTMAKYLKDDVLVSSDLSLDDFSLSQTSFIYAKNPDSGEYEQYQRIYATENRIWADYSEIPEQMIQATIAIEDKRFYEHQGVDWKRTVGACATMFFGSGDTFGGSTITQQLIKNLTDDDEVTVRRKLQEIFRALQFEKKYSKETIMEWYLNTIYLGEGAYGIKSAANVYFAKSLDQLTVAECATLISITNNPSMYDPYINPEKNLERRNVALHEMLDQGFLSQEEYDAAVNEPLTLKNGSAEETYVCPSCGEHVGEYSLVTKQVDYTEEELAAMRAEQSESDSEESDKELPTSYTVHSCPNCGAEITEDNVLEKDWDYSYFVDTVIRDVVADLQEKTGMDEDTCYMMVKSGGYHIYATIDQDVQAVVDDVYENVYNVPNTTSAQQLQSAIVVIDNETGDIVGMAGGVGKKEGSLTLNRATMSQRQPGSSIKPLTVYGPALEYGVITPGSIYQDAPYENDWPHNEGGGTSGKSMTVTQAVAASLNTISVRVLADLTPEASFEFATKKLNMTSLVDSVEIDGKEYSDIGLAPLALGALTYGVTVREMANGFACFPNDGVFREARTYTKVTDSEGNVILDNTQETHTAMSEKAAWAMSFMLQNAVETGTGAPAALYGITVAGKTGTSSDNVDRWFSGYTGYYTASVWCGFDEPEEVILSDSYTNPAVVMWRAVMAQLHDGLPNRSLYQGSFYVPVIEEKEVEICTKSGKLATDACRNDVEGSCVETKTYTNEDDIPTESCTDHIAVQWCVGGNAVANQYCASAAGNTVTTIGYWRGSNSVDTSHVCTVHTGQPDPTPPDPPIPDPDPDPDPTPDPTPNPTE